MVRVIRFLGVLPLLFVSGSAPPPLQIPEANEIPTWLRAGLLDAADCQAAERSSHQGRERLVGSFALHRADSLPHGRHPGQRFHGALRTPCPLRQRDPQFHHRWTMRNPINGGGCVLQFRRAERRGPGRPAGLSRRRRRPSVSTLNYNGNTPNIANAAVVALGTGGAITVQADATSIDLVIDVNGYYDGSGTLQLSLTRRAALDQFWTTQSGAVLGLTTVEALTCTSNPTAPTSGWRTCGGARSRACERATASYWRPGRGPRAPLESS